MKEYDGPCGARLVIDESQAFAEDPGQGTPAIVHWNGRTGTYWCVADCGECDGQLVPQEVSDWLDSDQIVEVIEAIEWIN